MPDETPVEATARSPSSGLLLRIDRLAAAKPTRASDLDNDGNDSNDDIRDVGMAHWLRPFSGS